MAGLASYCDLAIEANDFAVKERGAAIPGINEDREKLDDITITRIKVSTDEAAQELGKVPGTYITVEAPGLLEKNREEQNRIAGILGHELQQLLGFSDQGEEDCTVFVVGLGNWRATPDALGPRVVGHLIMTRHLYREAPPELRQGVRSVCGLAPGVLGITGIETGEIIRGIVDRIKPDYLVVVDALAAGAMERLGSTVQLSDTGIAPASGIGGRRLGINVETMGVPVIAVGVPTVVHALLLVRRTLDEFRNEARRLKGVGPLPNQVRDRIIQRVLEPFGDDAIMTPKGIDDLITEVSRTVAGAINIALHPDISEDNLSLYLH